jgi:uncharacterized protein
VFRDDPAQPWLDLLRRDVPDLELFDAHTHIGRSDPDGFSCTAEELNAALERAGARAAVFPMHEPDGYTAANDMVIDEAARSGGRLVAFCRLDPNDDPVAEAERALAAGARGIKLHPRAEQFLLEGDKVEAIFALADERRLPVLVHAGRGIPALGKDAVDLCERFPGARLILAHAGICDLAWIWRPAEGLPNLLFDTAWWSPSDLLALFALVPPGQVVFGSDAPYGTPAFNAVMTLRYALQVGLDEEQARGVGGAQFARLVAGEELLDLGPAPGPERLSRDVLLDRIYGFLMTAIGQMFNGIDPAEALALASLACEVGDDAPQAPVCRAILALIDGAGSFPRDPKRPARLLPGLPLIVAAAGICRTPDVPLVELEAPVGERTP